MPGLLFIYYDRLCFIVLFLMLSSVRKYEHFLFIIFSAIIGTSDALVRLQESQTPIVIPLTNVTLRPHHNIPAQLRISTPVFVNNSTLSSVHTPDTTISFLNDTVKSTLKKTSKHTSKVLNAEAVTPKLPAEGNHSIDALINSVLSGDKKGT